MHRVDLESDLLFLITDGKENFYFLIRKKREMPNFTKQEEIKLQIQKIPVELYNMPISDVIFSDKL